MGFSVKLKLPAGFDPRWLALAIGGILLALALLWIFRRPRASAPPARRTPPRKRPQEDLVLPMTIQDKYLLMLEEQKKEYKAGKMDEREAFQQLSRLVRAFVTERTGKKAENATLAEISGMHLPKLAKLIEVYYEPEFARDAEADIMACYANAGKVIKLWT